MSDQPSAPLVEPASVRSSLLDDLRSGLVDRARQAPKSDVTVRGIWLTQYVLRLLDDSTPFDLHYVLVQTTGLGCCYFSAASAPTLDSNILGVSALEHFDNPALEVAALDAVAASLDQTGESHVLQGENYQKSRARAALVCDEVVRLLPEHPRARRIGLVGVVGEFIHQLRDVPNIEITATDFAPRLMGKVMEAVTIQWGSATEDLIASVDVALVTGMTLANGTLADILTTARRHDTKIVLFAQTGHGFAADYLDRGVETVVSEPFPFYLSCAGPSRIRIARACHSDAS